MIYFQINLKFVFNLQKDWEQYLGMVDAACSILSELADFTHNNTL